MGKISRLKNVLFAFTVVIAFFCTAFVLKTTFYSRNKVLIVSASVKKSVNVGCSKKALINIFGKPDGDQKYYFEMDEKTGSVVSYKKDLFYFLDGKLTSFTISTNNFYIVLARNLSPLTVGTAPDFPVGWSKQTQKSVTYDLKNKDGSTTDQYLGLDLKAGRKQIERIILTDY